MFYEKKIPLKNYFFLFLIIIISIFLSIYFYLWYKAYNIDLICDSFVKEHLNVIKYNELDTFLIENKEAIIYFSYDNDHEIIKFEKSFFKLIDRYSLKNNILYLDVTNNVDSIMISDVYDNDYYLNSPCFLIFKNGKVNYIFDIKKSNYDIELFKQFLFESGVIDD